MAVARHLSKTRTTAVIEPPAQQRIHVPEDVRRRIAEKAYTLYEQRGKREGYALQDWLDAEYLVTEALYNIH